MRRILSLAALLCTLCAAAQTTYTNPVYDIDFPDPSVQRGQDGYWYAYSTGQKGARSTNLFKWTQLSNVISRPTWNDSTYIDSNGNKKTDYYSFWACDVNYVDGKYLMLYACALWGNGSRTGIGVATGTSPASFTDKGKMFRSTEIGVNNSIDPCYVEEFDKKYIVWGSFNDIYISELTDDGLAVRNPKSKTKIGGGAFEGAMIHKHGNYYYLFASIGSCCEGVNSTYRTVVGRSSKLTGPYVNKQGGTMFDNNYTTIIKANDRWKGPGHNSEIVTDDEGNDWLLYHAYDATNPEKGRVMLLDRITWDRDDWPVISDGTPSTTPQQAPVFYEKEGSVRTYRMVNADLSKGQWKGWNMTTSGDITTGTGSGTAFMPFGYVKGTGTFDISQTISSMENGIYEVQMSAFDTEPNVDFCVNQLPTLVHDSTYTSTYPISDATIASNFQRGRFVKKAYGLVHDGKLTLSLRSRNSLDASERFAVGNLKITFRYQDEELTKKLAGEYSDYIDALYAAAKPFAAAVRASVDKARADLGNAATATVRYQNLVTLAKAVTNMEKSIETYEALAEQQTWLAQKMEEARQGGYLTQDAIDVQAEAETVLQEQNYTDSDVQKLIARMTAVGEEMVYTYQQGDGTAAQPYVITRPEQLQNMRNVLQRAQTVYFVLDADIDMEGYEWEQLCASSSARFWINFDGRGHLIRNLHISSSTGYPSFFGIFAGECRNVGFLDADVSSTETGAGIIAALAGMTVYRDEEGNPLPCIIENCYVTGRVEGKDYAAAIAGTVNYSPVIIRNVYTNAHVVSNGTSSNYSGGLVGRVRTLLTIENSYAAGTVQGPVAASIAAGGQQSSTEASSYLNVLAWTEQVSGSRQAEPFAVTTEDDVLTNTAYFKDMLLDGEPVENGLSHTELQQKAALWGAPWHSDPTAGNGYPILQWQYSRGDYRQTCGFPIIDAIERVTGVPTPSVIYDLQGRRVGDAQDETTKLPKGIYIVNGRKVVK